MPSIQTVILSLLTMKPIFFAFAVSCAWASIVLGMSAEEVRLELSVSQSNGSIELVLKGIPGSKWILQSSSNMFSWSDIVSETVPEGGTHSLPDPSASGLDRRFYRARYTYGFDGGAGTENDPFLIANAEQLDNVRNYLDRHYRLIANIDLDISPYNEESGWEPIGDNNVSFDGSFDGNNKEIRNLFINQPSGERFGFFGISRANVKDLKLTNVDITAGNYAGALSGEQIRGSIVNCHVTGSVNGNSKVGGLVGSVHDSRITQSSAMNVSVNSTGDHVGGLVGRLELSRILDSFVNTTTVQGGGSYTGGLVGKALYSYLEDNHTSVNVSGVHQVGGLLGYSRAIIIDCSSRGTVAGTPFAGDFVGGLVGKGESPNSNNNPQDSIINSHSTANVGGHFSVGGLVGAFYNTNVRNSYAEGDVTATGNHAGGLIGFFSNNAHWREANIFNSYATGNVGGINNVGGLVGYSQRVTKNDIVDCYAVGMVTGNRNVGGLIGYGESYINRSHATGHVFGSGDYVGGLAGQTSSIDESYATGNVTSAGNLVGGFSGYHVGTIRKSFATGNVQGNNKVGGFTAGFNRFGGGINDSYAMGTVNGNDEVGGFIGHLTGTIRRCYAVGLVTGNANTGGLTGRKDSSGEIEYCYYDMNTTGHNNTDKGHPRTTAQMQSGPIPGNVAQPSIYEFWDPTVWDAVDNDSYPRHSPSD